MKLENTFKDWFSSLLGSAAMIYAGYGWHMEWVTTKEAGIVAFIGFVLLFLRTRLTQVISDGLGKVFEAVMKKIFGNGGGQPPAPTAIILLIILFSFGVDAQVINVKEARFINKTDSVGITGIGMQRWDNATGKFRFWNGSSWLSYETVANANGKFWKTSGTSTITNPVLTGNAVFTGTVTAQTSMSVGAAGVANAVIDLYRSAGGVTGRITQQVDVTRIDNVQGSGLMLATGGGDRLTMNGASIRALVPLLRTNSGAATITANTSLDIRGLGTTTANALRIASSANETRYTLLDNGSFTSTTIGGSFGTTADAGMVGFFHPNAVTVDGGLNNSPTFRLTGRYDSDATTTIVSSDYNLDLVHTMTAGGASPASKLSINNHAGTELLNITSTGNVGIGIPATQKLHVSRGATDGTIARFEGGATLFSTYLFQDFSAAKLVTSIDRPISFAPNEIERMWVTSTGVGIGYATPNAPLQFANGTVNRKLVLHEGANNDHQFRGFGTSTPGGLDIMRYQSDDPTVDHVFYAGTSATTSNELFRIKGNGNIDISPTTSDSEIFSANWVPTLTNSANAATSLANTCRFIRVGNMVTISGWIDVDATNASTTTIVEFTLPVASNLSAADKLSGTVNASGGNGYGTLTANATTDKAILSVFPTTNVNVSYMFQGTYEIQ